jgi:multicomponent Na+:H+ antiporter subunit F
MEILPNFLYYFVLPVLTVSVVLVFVRFLLGPSLADRVVSLDLLITIGIGIITVIAIVSDRTSFLDIAMILALIAFLGTVAFSYYMEKSNRNL